VSRNIARRRWRLAVRLTAAALVWSAGLLIAAVVLPVYGDRTTTSSQGITLTSATLVQVNGARALIIVAIPLVASLGAALALYRRWVTGAAWSGPVAWTMIAVLAAEALLGILSIGVFVLPVVILLAVAARLVVEPERIRPPTSSQRTA
jgi:hypothetical protein